MYLAQKYNLQAVLINPSINPHVTLGRTLGQTPNFYDESHFEWKNKHIEMLKTYRTNPTHSSNIMLFLQKGDELLDYKEALYYLPNVKRVVEEKGSHSFEGIQRHFEIIRNFFLVGNYFKHTMRVKGVGCTNEELASRIGDLYYDSLAKFLIDLSMKIFDDAMGDYDRGRKKLSDALFEARKSLGEAIRHINKAWSLSEKHMFTWLANNGDNRQRYIFNKPILNKSSDTSNFPNIIMVKKMPYKATVRVDDAWIVAHYLQTGGWELKCDNITPPPPRDTHPMDKGRHYQHNHTSRYTAMKDSIYLFFDDENNTGEGHTMIYYSDDTKAMVEETILPMLRVTERI
jgi:hypothetical protein